MQLSKYRRRDAQFLWLTSNPLDKELFTGPSHRPTPGVSLDDLSRLFDLEALVWAKRERLGSSNTLMS